MGLNMGDVVGTIPKEIQKRFLGYHIRAGAAWDELQQIELRIIRLLDEISRERGLSEWIFYVETVTGKIVLERQKTAAEIALSQHQKKLLSEEAKEEVTKNGI